MNRLFEQKPFRKFRLEPIELLLTAAEIGFGLLLWRRWGYGFWGGLLIGASLGCYYKRRAVALAAIERLRT